MIIRYNISVSTLLDSKKKKALKNQGRHINYVTVIVVAITVMCACYVIDTYQFSKFFIFKFYFGTIEISIVNTVQIKG